MNLSVISVIQRRWRSNQGVREELEDENNLWDGNMRVENLRICEGLRIDQYELFFPSLSSFLQYFSVLFCIYGRLLLFKTAFIY